MQAAEWISTFFTDLEGLLNTAHQSDLDSLKRIKARIDGLTVPVLPPQMRTENATVTTAAPKLSGGGVEKKRGGRRPKGAPRTCPKHPDNREFNTAGGCRLCAREYQKAFYERKRAQRDSSAAASRPPQPAQSDNRVQCLDCGEKFPDAKAMGIHRSRVHF